MISTLFLTNAQMVFRGQKCYSRKLLLLAVLNGPLHARHVYNLVLLLPALRSMPIQ